MTCIEHTQAGKYAYTKVNQKCIGQHVLVLINKTGEASNGRVARHSCDNTRCLNPDHLSWGTHKDNTADMVLRQRHRKVQATLRKLSEADIRNIRSSPLGNKALGKLYGVDPNTVRSVKRRMTYKEVILT